MILLLAFYRSIHTVDITHYNTRWNNYMCLLLYESIDIHVYSIKYMYTKLLLHSAKQISQKQSFVLPTVPSAWCGGFLTINIHPHFAHMPDDVTMPKFLLFAGYPIKYTCA